MATTYLSRTLGTPTNNKKWTFSCWLKYTRYSGTYPNSEAPFFHADAGSTTSWSFIGLDEANQLILQNRISSANVGYIISNAKLQDAGAWYNVVAVFDSSNSTSADRQILYLNGERITSFAGETQAPLDTASNINSAIEHRIGRGHGHYGSKYFGGLMTHVNFIDGTAYPATAFGEVDSTSGIWTAKTTPSVTYGNNGFFLKMENASAMGTDSSGKSNTFTVSGSLTKNQDTPNNNFATMNPLDNYYSAATFSNGNNTVATAAAPVNWVASTFQVNKGKWYAECKPTAGTGSALVGFAGSTSKNSTQILETAGFFGGNYVNNGEYFFNGSGGAYAAAFSNGNIISVYLDLDNNFVYFAKNGTLQNSGDPTSGGTGTGGKAITAAASVTNGGYAFACGDGNTATRTFDWNFGNGYFGTTPVSSAGTNASGNGIFEYDVPTGYTALSTEGLNS